ncbi:protein of unknown function DUF1573 [Paludibacter propionicigenes WB4]|uniref:DUF1573 domain-containing protein n=1 Tax=Paludibacter propionicigenes (strain DSM 17365 / JCM 13257 / WB4) TaxID=694427 RepID=E4T4R6_PALPW|nr:DUF1573 domain-containing protein [Paludibacter propionicigenes]ADQ79710.1 protein of unknown function DUF1573 [Paludibacter propionicigenes WB4]
MRTIGNRVRCIIMLLLVLCIQSCDNKKNRAELVVKKWIQKEIQIPGNITFKSVGRDTVCSRIMKHRNIVLVYIDSLGCAACKLRLAEWKAFIETCQKMSYDVGFLFVVQSTNYKDLENKLLLDDFTYPIIYDYKGDFDRINSFPKEEEFRTLLLDRRHRVVLIGSPVRSHKMKQLFYKVISNGDFNEVRFRNIETYYLKETTVNLDKDSINLGKFSFKTSKHLIFKIRNVGNNPLLINTVNTSCGCTLAKYDKKPIPQGETTTVVLEYRPNSLGYFSKTADVMCNVPNGLVRLKISGEVVEK